MPSPHSFFSISWPLGHVSGKLRQKKFTWVQDVESSYKDSYNWGLATDLWTLPGGQLAHSPFSFLELGLGFPI